MRTTLVALLLAYTIPTPLRAAEEPSDECLEVIREAPAEDCECPRSQLLWGRAEYLLWTVKDDRPPGPLLTTGPAGVAGSGVLGQPGTGVLYDGSHLDYGLNSGGYLQLGCWINAQRTLGIQVAGFVLETHTIHGEVNSNRTTGAPVIARPFFNVLTGQENAQIITTPQDAAGGRYLGGIDIFGDSRTWGGEGNVVQYVGGFGKWTLLTGFRYLGQKDEFRFSQSSTVLTAGDLYFLGSQVKAPNIVSVRDYYETHNHFYGGQVGAFGEYQLARFVLSLSGKLALGATHQDLSVSGHTLLTDSTGLTLAAPGGLYTQPTNIGDFQRYRFSVASEVMVRLGYAITENLRTHVGWNFLYWGRVARPGAQVNRNLDPRQIASNPAYDAAAAVEQPAPLFRSTDFWAQGLALGLEWQY